MLSFRSTINKGGSWHAWPDSRGHILWDLPKEGKAGAWREALPDSPIKPHGNGLHSARWREMAYWFGPMNFIMKSDNRALNENDWYADQHPEAGILVSREARLVTELPNTTAMWQEISLNCADMVLKTPDVLNYTGRYVERAKTEAITYPGSYSIFQNADKKYNWQLTLNNTKELLAALNKTYGEVWPKKLADFTPAYQNLIQEQGHIFKLMTTQANGHIQSIGRCEEYEHHNQGLVAAFNALIALKDWLPTNQPAQADNYNVIANVVKNTRKAFQHFGAEQARLMLQPDSEYTIETGLGPMLEKLPFIGEKDLNGFSPADITGRAAMLKMSEFLANGFGLKEEYAADMQNQQPLNEYFDKLIQHQKQFQL